MNRFTELSKSVRQEIKGQRLAAESEADRAKRMADEKIQAQVRLLRERVAPVLEEVRSGLEADNIDAKVSLRAGADSAALLTIDGGLNRVDDRTFEVGQTYELITTTAGGAFLVQVHGGLKEPTQKIANDMELEEVIFASVETLLRRYLGPID